MKWLASEGGTQHQMRNDLAGAHVLNKFVWQKLKESEIMVPSNYGGLIPIIPSQQVPVFNEFPTSTPYIVYTYTNMGYDSDFWADREQILYRVYSDNERQIRQITNFLIDLLKRYDWTAEEINDWITQFASTDGDEKKFNFYWTQVVSSIGPEPYATEGGRQAGSVSVSYVYTHNQEGRPGVSGKGMRV